MQIKIKRVNAGEEIKKGECRESARERERERERGGGAGKGVKKWDVEEEEATRKMIRLGHRY